MWQPCPYLQDTAQTQSQLKGNSIIHSYYRDINSHMLIIGANYRLKASTVLKNNISNDVSVHSLLTVKSILTELDYGFLEWPVPPASGGPTSSRPRIREEEVLRLDVTMDDVQPLKYFQSTSYSSVCACERVINSM